jgi:tetratricopeptide (TPR) repeat protein
MYLILKVADAVDTDPHSLESLTYFRTHPRASDREANLDSWKGELKRNQARIDDALALIQNNLALDMAIALLDSALVYFPNLIILRHNRASAWHRVWLNSLPVGPNTPQTAFALYAPDIMEMLRSEGDQTAFRNAVSDYEAVLASFSAPQTRSQLASLMASSGDWEEAATLNDQALAENPIDPVVLANASAVLLYASNAELAASYAQEAIERLDSKRRSINKTVVGAALYNYGLAAEALGHHEEAEEAFRMYASEIDSTSRFSRLALSRTAESIPRTPLVSENPEDLTVAGVSLGDSRDVIEELFGPAESVTSVGNGLMLAYPSRGLSFYVLDNTCLLIGVASPFSGTVLGVPLGAALAEAQDLLGDPYRETQAGWRDYRAAGLSLHSTRDVVDRILVAG